MIQKLEQRRLLSMTLEEGYPGFWELYGDANDNNIRIEFQTISGQTTLIVNDYIAGTGEFITVYSYGGSDTVTAKKVGEVEAAGVAIHLGDGVYDKATITGIGGAIWGEAGRDEIKLQDVWRGELYGDSGDDILTVAGLSYDAEVRGGAGNDVIYADQFAIGESSPTGLVLHGGSDNDTIYGSQKDDALYGDGGRDELYGLGGNDTLNCWDLDDNDIAMGGPGYDILHYDGPHEAGIYGIEMGVPH